jgi:hypothetical protein
MSKLLKTRVKDVFTLVDDDTYERFRWRQWTVSPQGYAVSKGELLHRLIMAPVPLGFEVDHVNQDTLDNRRENLRLATRAQNTTNGVRQNDPRCHINVRERAFDNSYHVEIRRRSGHFNQTFNTIEEAQQARNAWLKQHDPFKRST